MLSLHSIGIEKVSVFKVLVYIFLFVTEIYQIIDEFPVLFLWLNIFFVFLFVLFQGLNLFLYGVLFRLFRFVKLTQKQFGNYFMTFFILGSDYARCELDYTFHRQSLPDLQFELDLSLILLYFNLAIFLYTFEKTFDEHFGTGIKFQVLLELLEKFKVYFPKPKILSAVSQVHCRVVLTLLPFNQQNILFVLKVPFDV